MRSDLVRQYEDEPGLRPVELSLLSAPPPGEDDLAEFYVRFEKIKDFHHRNPGINARQFVSELDELVRGDGMQVFMVEGEDEPTVIDRQLLHILRQLELTSSYGQCLQRRRGIRKAS